MKQIALNKSDIIHFHILDQIKKHTDDLGFIIEEPADLDTSFKNAGIDSLDLLEIAFDLEKCYGIEVPSDDLNPDMTFSALIEIVYNLIPE